MQQGLAKAKGHLPAAQKPQWLGGSCLDAPGFAERERERERESSTSQPLGSSRTWHIVGTQKMLG